MGVPSLSILPPLDKYECSVSILNFDCPSKLETATSFQPQYFFVFYLTLN